MHKLFELRGTLEKKTNLSIGLIGFLLLLIVWSSVGWLHLIKEQLLPPPWKIPAALFELHMQEALIRNLGYSIYLNVLGYLEAIVVSLIVGFIMGLFPLFRGLFSQYLNASRFIPMTAVTGLFIAWAGIDTNMKAQFLAFGIMVYMIPVVMQRIDEVDQVFEQTAITLGANSWQRILHVYIPSVLSKLSDDIRVLVAISWTYIIVAEMVNAHAGVGYLIGLAQRRSRVDMTFAILFLIIVVGFLQDQIFKILDKKFFPYKYL